MEDKFNSKEELYKRLLPALSSKKREIFSRFKIMLLEEEIWNYLCAYVWINKQGLTLGEMVDDILNFDSVTLFQGIRKGDINGTYNG